jgi:hypothetical protein
LTKAIITPVDTVRGVENWGKHPPVHRIRYVEASGNLEPFDIPGDVKASGYLETVHGFGQVEDSAPWKPSTSRAMLKTPALGIVTLPDAILKTPAPWKPFTSPAAKLKTPDA